MKTLKPLIISSLLLIVISSLAIAQGNQRKEIKIPDIPGYKTLKCDFHMHTVFSDGNVWPTVRVYEAWLDGLDAIAITDHIEYQPHSKDIPSNFNRAHELASPVGDNLDIIVIKGSEVTRKMPPGHLNAIFISNANALKTDDWRDALKAAKEQGAFIFWNHPNWKGHQKDGIARWYDEHSYLLENGLVNGIEVLNGYEYSPEAQRWCLEHNLTFMGNTDVHDPIRMEYNYMENERRAMTLVFAKEKSEGAVKEALFAGRTVVLFNDTLIGKEKFLLPLFEASVKYNRDKIVLKKKESFNLQVTNWSDVPFILISQNEKEEISITQNVTLLPGSTGIIKISTSEKAPAGGVKLKFKVINMWTSPEEHPVVTLPVKVEVE
jgi:hypothetical protein